MWNPSMVFLVIGDMVEAIEQVFDKQKWLSRYAHFEYLMFEKKFS
jgi:hypothetical protein